MAQPCDKKVDSVETFASGRETREACRSGAFKVQTSGQASGYAQANICILPRQYAFDFLLFCQRNPKSCPLIEVSDTPVFTGVDIRTDLPKYRVYENGTLTSEIFDITDIWREDFVTFVIDALIRAGLNIRHIDMGINVPMYNTNIPCRPAGCFEGNLVVSMRPFTPKDAIRATEITSRYPRVHGSPVHIGDPASLGIADLDRPDYGDAVEIRPGEVPVFWACGVTPQAVVMSSRPSICITHAPGHMLVLDMLNDELSVS